MVAPSRRNRLLIAIAAAVVLSISAVVYVLAPSAPGSTAAQAAAIGGPFRLTTQQGHMLSNVDLKGRPFAVFFGFTHCPEICPTTLWELSETLKQLGPAADDLNVVFVSLDPTRDTPEMLKTYLQSFDPHIIGLTGPQGEIEALAKAFKVYWRKVPTAGGDYTLDHTAIVYLMDRKGIFAGTLAYQEQADVRIAKLKRLLAGEAP